MNIQEIQLKYTPVKKQDRIKITNSESAYKAFLETWNKDTLELQEEFKIMLLNQANEVIGVHTLSKGGIASTVVDIKLLFSITLKAVSSNIILCHNHPSGNLQPSQADKNLYYKIQKAARFLDIQILDNLIISNNGFYSFTDHQLM